MANPSLNIFVDATEADSLNDFLRRNMNTLKKNPRLCNRVTHLIDSGQAIIFLTSKTGLVAEMSYPMLEVVSLMKRGGCK